MAVCTYLPDSRLDEQKLEIKGSNEIGRWVEGHLAEAQVILESIYS